MLVTGWPDCGARLLRVGCDGFEAFGVRAAALAFVCAAAAVDPLELAGADAGACAADTPAAEAALGREAGPVDEPPPPGTAPEAGQQEGQQEGEQGGDKAAAPPGAPRQLHRLGLASLLQQQQLWEALPPLLARPAADAAPPALLAAAAALAAQALAADPSGVGLRLLLAQRTWEGPQPVVARTLQAALPGAPGPGFGSAAEGPGADVPSSLLAVVACGAEAQRGAGALPSACAAHLRALEWLTAAG
jgi:hypothetical protein